MMPAQVHTFNGAGDDLEDPLFEVRINAAVEQIDHVPLRELRNQAYAPRVIAACPTIAEAADRPPLNFQVRC